MKHEPASSSWITLLRQTRPLRLGLRHECHRWPSLIATFSTTFGPNPSRCHPASPAAADRQILRENSIGLRPVPAVHHMASVLLGGGRSRSASELLLGGAVSSVNTRHLPGAPAWSPVRCLRGPGPSCCAVHRSTFLRTHHARTALQFERCLHTGPVACISIDMGMSIWRYLHAARMDQAVARLRKGDKVESVLATVGWRGRKNFFRHFKARDWNDAANIATAGSAFASGRTPAFAALSDRSASAVSANSQTSQRRAHRAATAPFPLDSGLKATRSADGDEAPELRNAAYTPRGPRLG